MIKMAVKIKPRQVILDTQGRAVENFVKVKDVATKLVRARVGKYIELEFDEPSVEAASLEAHKLCRELLVNPLIEDYELEVLNK